MMKSPVEIFVIFTVLSFVSFSVVFMCVGVYVCVQGCFVVHNILLSVFSNKNSQNFREIYFGLKKNLKSLTHYSYLIKFVVIYTGALYAS